MLQCCALVVFVVLVVVVVSGHLLPNRHFHRNELGKRLYLVASIGDNLVVAAGLAFFGNEQEHWHVERCYEGHLGSGKAVLAANISLCIVRNLSYYISKVQHGSSPTGCQYNSIIVRYFAEWSYYSGMPQSGTLK